MAIHPKSSRHRTAAIAIVAIAIVPATVGATARPGHIPRAADPPPAVCTLTPEQDATPTESGLTTVLATADGLAILHRVDCDGRTVTWRWLTRDDILHG
jgi:hypothetical protein